VDSSPCNGRLNMRYFTADLHLGHTNVIKYNNRPFDNVLEQDDTIIRNINAICKPKDELYILGDFCFHSRATDIIAYAERINARVHFIFGNHDHKKIRKLNCFETKQYYLELKKPHHMVLCHYPMTFWNRSNHGSFMLHGHCHGAYKDTSRYIMDVGVDCHDYCPISE